MINNSINSIFENFPILISLFALLISFLTLYRQRKQITVTFQPNIYPISKEDVSMTSLKRESILGRDAYKTSVDIVNSSPLDIGFFDLRVFNPETNVNYYLATKKSLAEIGNNDLYLHYSDGVTKLEIPDKNHGVLKANSYTTLDIIIVTNGKDSNKIGLAFKIPKSVFFGRDSFSVTNRKKFKAFGIIYDLSKTV